MKKILLIMACMAALGAQAQGPYRFTLEECLAYAMGNNYTRQSMLLSQDAAADNLAQSRLERLPGVSASASESFSASNERGSSWTGSYGVDASMPLYKGGSISTTIEQNQLFVEQSAANTAQYDNALTVQIVQAFLTTLGNEELLKDQRAIVQASEEGVRQGEAQYAAGTILESDYLLLKAQYASDANNITDTEISVQNNLLVLKGLLSMPATTELQINYPEASVTEGMGVLPEMDRVLERARASMPEFRISQYSVDIAGKDVMLARSGYMPTLTLGAGAGTGHGPDFYNYGQQLNDGLNGQVGLSLSVPIFNNGRTRSRVTQSRIALQQAQLDQKQTEIDLLQSVAVDYQDVVSSWNKYRTTDIRQDAYLHTFEAYRAQFNAGAITAVDLLQQQNNYIGALNDYIQSKYSFILKRKILDVYMGVPVTM